MNQTESFTPGGAQRVLMLMDEPRAAVARDGCPLPRAAGRPTGEPRRRSGILGAMYDSASNSPTARHHAR